VPAIAVILFAALGQGAEQATDLVFLKDGTKRSGLIVEETDETLILQITIKGPKGETAVTAKQSILKEEILEIRRMAPEAREKEKAKVDAFGIRTAWEREDRRALIQVTPAKFAEFDGLSAAGDQFEVFTTSGEDFAKDACDALQQAYEGYLRHFRLRRKGAQRVPVYILSGREQYDEYLRRKYGEVISNPAFYDPTDNVIVACNFVQKEEAARVRAEIREERKEIEAYTKELKDAEEAIDEWVKAARKRVFDEAAEARAEIRRDDPVNRPALLLEVDRWQAEQLDRVRIRKNRREKNVDEMRKRAEAAIEDGRQTIRRNQQVLREQNREVFEILLHECFHAFARNRLFTDREIPRWLNEGMASYFEMSVVENGELIHGAPNSHLLKCYREAETKRHLPRLDHVLRAGGEMFLVLHKGQIDRSNRAYAVSWALAHYISSRMTAEQTDAYVSDVAAGTDAADALAKSLKQPIWKIEEAVRAHVATLK
jgi:hypothetical protein